MAILRHAKELGHLFCSLRLVRIVHDMSEYRGLDLACFESPIDGFYLVKDADARWRELEFEDPQLHHVRGPWFVG